MPEFRNAGRSAENETYNSLPILNHTSVVTLSERLASVGLSQHLGHFRASESDVEIPHFLYDGYTLTKVSLGVGPHTSSPMA